MTTADGSDARQARPKLARVRRNRGWGQERAASEIVELGLHLGFPAERLGVDARAISRWENGRTEPGPVYITIMCRLYALPPDQLDLPSSALPIDPTSQTTPEDAAAASQHDATSSAVTSQPSHPAELSGQSDLISGAVVPIRGTLDLWQPSASLNRTELISSSEWPVWFGIRIAHVIALVDNWQGPTTQFDALQAVLHQEILMFDAIAPENHDAVHTLTRRQALVTLAALPLTIASSGVGTLGAAAATEFFLSRCAASLTACWHLLRGSDLPTIESTLSGYVLALEGAAQRESAHQAAAARLASQAHRISGIIALHRNQLRARERHCKQALHYATMASDVSSQVSALISLASTYFYGGDPAQAGSVYEQALTFESAMPPLQRSRVHAELAVVYGQLGREQDAVRSAELAEQLYPDDPERDRSFLYAEFTAASLTLEQGLAYVALAEQFPDRDYQRRAAAIFARVERATGAIVPDRIRFEIVNHQARTAVLLNDLDAFEMYMGRGIDGVVLLGSKQRQKEVQFAWQRAIETWPRERRLKALSERMQPTTNGSEGAPE
jgi:tetratricopeptide (TPR) repeat protein